MFKIRPICSKFKRNMFKPTPVEPTQEPGCRFCKAVATAGRSGEKTIKFVGGETATVEVINETHVDGKLCYTLYVMNDPEIGWNEVPIKFCPFCSKPLRRKK